MEPRNLYLLFLLLSAMIGLSLACDGFKMKILSVKNCGDANQIIKISQNSTIKLNKNCEIIPKTCAETKGFTTAIVTYRVTKNTIPIYSGTEDMCAKMKSSGGDVKELLKVFQLPDHCPVEKNKVCASGDQKIDISKQKRMLPMAMGRLTMHVDIKHDTGTSCMELELEVKK